MTENNLISANALFMNFDSLINLFRIKSSLYIECRYIVQHNI